MKKITMLFVVLLVASTSLFAGNRHYHGPQIRRYSSMPNRVHYSNHRTVYYRNYHHRSSSIDRDLHRISYGVGIVGDIVDIYNAARGRTTTVYETAVTPVVVQPTPVVYQQPPVVYQVQPVYDAPIRSPYPVIIQTPQLILQSGAVIK